MFAVNRTGPPKKRSERLRRQHGAPQSARELVWVRGVVARPTAFPPTDVLPRGAQVWLFIIPKTVRRGPTRVRHPRGPSTSDPPESGVHCRARFGGGGGSKPVPYGGEQGSDNQEASCFLHRQRH
ncbi:hypothetical protein V5799_021839, partial [Amblyomma americanum]